MPRLPYTVTAKGNRGDVHSRQGSRRSGVVGSVSTAAHIVSTRLTRHSAYGDWLCISVDGHVLYEGPLEDVLTRMPPCTMQTPVCTSRRKHLEALALYANKRYYKKGMFDSVVPIIEDGGRTARRALGARDA